MQQMLRVVSIIVGLATILTTSTRANNIRVENVVMRPLNQASHTLEVQFDLSWDNSWRNDLNHDAAWGFIKFRAPGSNHWEHAYLSTNAADHTVSGGVIEVGTSSNAVSDALGVGVFVYPDAAYTGTVNYARTRLLWQYGTNGYDFAEGESIDVSVHAIEMVYVAEGSFSVGSGGTESRSFTDGSWVSGATIPLEITSEAALNIGTNAGMLWANDTNYIGAAGTLPAAFPKGYGAFYCMKYQVTQGQYVEFLNRLTYAQQVSRITGNPNDPAGTYPLGTYRHAIYIDTPGVASGTPAMYATDNPYVACNYVIYPDEAAYMQWAGLRPMTELEYEKACRGPAEPVPGEYAWGTASVRGSTRYTLSNDGAFDEGVNNPTDSDTVGNAVYSDTRASLPSGPLRVGVFATSSTVSTNDRARTGASYWGIMELSGNLMELPATVDGARQFEGSHGDGVLSVAGHATHADWPGYSGGTVTAVTGSRHQAGSFGEDKTRMAVSARYSNVNNASLKSGIYFGMRGVRSAP